MIEVTKEGLKREDITLTSYGFEEHIELMEYAYMLLCKQLGVDPPKHEVGPGYNQPDRRVARVLDYQNVLLAATKVTWDDVVTEARLGPLATRVSAEDPFPAEPPPEKISPSPLPAESPAVLSNDSVSPQPPRRTNPRSPR